MNPVKDLIGWLISVQQKPNNNVDPEAVITDPQATQFPSTNQQIHGITTVIDIENRP
jgi:hypothetical protein